MPMRMLLLSIVLLITAAACGSQPEPIATSTPPLPTAEPQIEQATAPPPPSRPTLPATWTPFFEPTLTPITGLPRANATNQYLLALPTLATCSTFTVDFERTPKTFTAAQPVTVYWLPAMGATSYRITLYNANFEMLLTRTTEATEFTLPGEFFLLSEIYAWEVVPYDALGIQFCLPIGGELTSF